MGSRSKKLLIVEQSLKQLSGHYYEYARSLSDVAAQRGVPVTILGHRSIDPALANALSVRPIFRRTFYDGPSGVLANHLIDPLYSNWVYYQDLCRGTSGLGDEETIVFASTVDHRQMLAFALWLARFRSEKSPMVVLHFFNSYRRLDKKRPWGANVIWARLAFRSLEALAPRYRIRLATPSARLGKEYSRLTHLRVEIFPFPLAGHFCFQESQQKSQMEMMLQRPFRMVALGSAREEKGWPVLVEAILQLNDDLEIRDQVQFILQSNFYPEPDEATLQAYRRLRERRLSNVYLIDRSLPTDEYYRLLMDSSCVILPYRRSSYYSRTSGILVEAIAAGKPVITTIDTWLADELKAHGAGLTFEDGSVDGLVSAIRQMIEQMDQFAHQAQQSRAAWVQIHNPSNLFDQILEG